MPTRNQAEVLPELRRPLVQALSGPADEVLILDDSTHEVTRRTLGQIAASDPSWAVMERDTHAPRGLGRRSQAASASPGVRRSVSWT